MLVLIVALAAFLRLYKLSSIPPGVNRDEASIGYTAYSLLKTGKDEYGRTWPVSFQSFGDWKLPLYIYTTVPFVKVFGLNELAVRLPSVLAGILTVLLTYFLVKELFRNSLIVDRLSLIAAFLLSISPWHLHLSRVESESNLAVLFIVSGLLCFLKAIRNDKKTYFYYPAFILFALTYYTYHGSHLTTTLILGGLCFIYFKKIRKDLNFSMALVIFLLLVSSIFAKTLFSADKTKLAGISIFGDPGVVHQKIELPRLEHQNPSSLWARLEHNRVTYALVTVTKNYLAAFSPKFLFLAGGGNRAHNIANFGNLYLAEAPFFCLGICYLLGKRKELFGRLLLWWLLVSPIAASLTKDAPHTNRMFAIYPLPPILTALGLIWAARRIRETVGKRMTIILLSLIALGFTANFLIYLDRYFFRFPREEARYWGYGYQKLTAMLDNPENLSKKIVISHPEASPYIYYLFYSAYDPARYQREAVRYPPTEDQFIHVASFDRFEFRAIDWNRDLKLDNTLLIDFSQNIPQELVKVSQNIYLPNRDPFLSIIASNNN